MASTSDARRLTTRWKRVPAMKITALGGNRGPSYFRRGGAIFPRALSKVSSVTPAARGLYEPFALGPFIRRRRSLCRRNALSFGLSIGHWGSPSSSRSIVEAGRLSGNAKRGQSRKYSGWPGSSGTGTQRYRAADLALALWDASRQPHRTKPPL